MTAGIDWSSLLWWIAGALLGLLALALLVWSLVLDFARHRGRLRRCPKCWYDMSATDSRRCSECGHEARRERKLHKSRRRWRWAAVAIVLLIGSAVIALQPKVRRDGWWSLVSNRMLIAGLPFARDIDDFWCREMARRVQLGKRIRNRRFGTATATPAMNQMNLAIYEWQLFFDRCIQGDWRARPVSDAWQRKYGELIHAWTSYSFGDDQMPLPLAWDLLALPPKLQVKHRETWPTDVPVYVEFHVENWWPADAEFRTEIVPRLDGAQPIAIGDPRTAYGFVAPADFDGDEIIFDLTTEVPQSGPPDQRNRWTETIRVTVHRQGVLAEHMKPVASPKMDAAMGAMVFEIGRNELAPDSSSIETQLFRDVAIGAQFEYMLDGEVIFTQANWWPGSESIWLFRPGETHGDVDRLMGKASAGENWALRICSDPALALRVFDHDKYWEGDVIIPLTILGE